MTVSDLGVLVSIATFFVIFLACGIFMWLKVIKEKMDQIEIIFEQIEANTFKSCLYDRIKLREERGIDLDQFYRMYMERIEESVIKDLESMAKEPDPGQYDDDIDFATMMQNPDIDFDAADND